MARRCGTANVTASVIGVMVMLICSSGAQAEDKATNATAEETRQLLSVCLLQAEAVTAYSEALMTWRAARRAQMYSNKASGEEQDPPPLVPADYQAMEGKLAALEDRFFHVYIAHNGKIIHGSHGETRGETYAMSEQANRLAFNPEARAEARRTFISDCRQARDEAHHLLATAREHLAKLQKRAVDEELLPAFEPTPRFEDKPRATLKADGTATGVLFGMPFGYAERQALKPLGIDMLGGVFEKYDTDYKVSPVKIAADQGQVAQVIVPCARSSETYCDSELIRLHRDKPILRAGVPKDRLYRGEWMWPLDQFHPLVRQMLAEYLTEVGRRYKGNPHVLTYTTAWEAIFGDSSGEWGKWPTGGRTPAANDAFRAYLKKKFDTIDQLNEAWKSDYDSFEAIEPPADVHHGPGPQRVALVTRLASGACPPLYYEYNRFLKDSFADYLAWCYRILKKANPTTPVSISPSHGVIDGYLCTSRDSFLWAEHACDVWGSENHTAIEEVLTYSIQRALRRETAIFEWTWNGYENWSNPSEAVSRAAAQRNIWRLIAWGRKILAFYGASDSYSGKAYNNMLVLESDYHLLRLSAGVIGPMKRKMRSMEDVWVDAPVVKPEIAMLKPSVSQICAWPYEIVTAITQNLHGVLYADNYHYAFVPEEYIVSGRDELDRYKVLILPNATHFPSGLTEKILPWVEGGGTLIISGIAGGFTPYGVEDGALMKAIFGEIRYRPWEEKWMIEFVDLKSTVRDLSTTAGEILLADYGKGKVLLAARRGDLRPGGAAVPIMRRLVDSVAPRPAWAEGAELEMILRESDGRLHMTLINPNSQEPADARIHVARPHRLAVDRGIEGGFAVPLVRKGPNQVFEISLSPGEGTLIELFPAESSR